jgi:hypothetical protein
MRVGTTQEIEGRSSPSSNISSSSKILRSSLHKSKKIIKGPLCFWPFFKKILWYQKIGRFVFLSEIFLNYIITSSGTVPSLYFMCIRLDSMLPLLYALPPSRYFE